MATYKADINVKRIMSLLNIELWDIQRRIGVDILKSVAKETPVDTGRARASWGMHTRAGVSDDVGEIKGKGMNEQQAQAVALSHMGDVPRKAPMVPTPIVVSNYVEYIKYLNDGHSDQGGKHMVERALDKVKARSER